MIIGFLNVCAIDIEFKFVDLSNCIIIQEFDLHKKKQFKYWDLNYFLSDNIPTSKLCLPYRKIISNKRFRLKL